MSESTENHETSDFQIIDYKDFTIYQTGTAGEFEKDVFVTSLQDPENDKRAQRKFFYYLDSDSEIAGSAARSRCLCQFRGLFPDQKIYLRYLPSESRDKEDMFFAREVFEILKMLLSRTDKWIEDKLNKREKETVPVDQNKYTRVMFKEQVHQLFTEFGTDKELVTLVPDIHFLSALQDHVDGVDDTVYFLDWDSYKMMSGLQAIYAIFTECVCGLYWDMENENTVDLDSYRAKVQKVLQKYNKMDETLLIRRNEVMNDIASIEGHYHYWTLIDHSKYKPDFEFFEENEDGSILRNQYDEITMSYNLPGFEYCDAPCEDGTQVLLNEIPMRHARLMCQAGWVLRVFGGTPKLKFVILESLKYGLKQEEWDNFFVQMRKAFKKSASQSARCSARKTGEPKNQQTPDPYNKLLEKGKLRQQQIKDRRELEKKKAGKVDYAPRKNTNELDVSKPDTPKPVTLEPKVSTPAEGPVATPTTLEPSVSTQCPFGTTPTSFNSSEVSKPSVLEPSSLEPSLETASLEPDVLKPTALEPTQETSYLQTVSADLPNSDSPTSNSISTPITSDSPISEPPTSKPSFESGVEKSPPPSKKMIFSVRAGKWIEISKLSKMLKAQKPRKSQNRKPKSSESSDSDSSNYEVLVTKTFKNPEHQNCENIVHSDSESSGDSDIICQEDSKSLTASEILDSDEIDLKSSNIDPKLYNTVFTILNLEQVPLELKKSWVKQLSVDLKYSEIQKTYISTQTDFGASEELLTAQKTLKETQNLLGTSEAKVDNLETILVGKDKEMEKKDYEYNRELKQKNEEIEKLKRELLDFEKGQEDSKTLKNQIGDLKEELEMSKKAIGDLLERFNTTSEALENSKIENSNLKNQIGILNEKLTKIEEKSGLEYESQATSDRFIEISEKNQEIEILRTSENEILSEMNDTIMRLTEKISQRDQEIFELNNILNFENLSMIRKTEKLEEDVQNFKKNLDVRNLEMWRDIQGKMKHLGHSQFRIPREFQERLNHLEMENQKLEDTVFTLQRLQYKQWKNIENSGLIETMDPSRIPNSDSSSESFPLSYPGTV